ncbi:MAG: tetratricopeptide repeat protein [Bacteroidota bacterium]
MQGVLFDKKDYHEAEKIFLKICNKTLNDNNLIGQVYSSFSLASTYLKLEDLQRADSFAEKAGILAARWKQPEFIQSVYSVKSDLYKAQGRRFGLQVSMEKAACSPFLSRWPWHPEFQPRACVLRLRTPSVFFYLQMQRSA